MINNVPPPSGATMIPTTPKLCRILRQRLLPVVVFLVAVSFFAGPLALSAQESGAAVVEVSARVVDVGQAWDTEELERILRASLTQRLTMSNAPDPSSEIWTEGEGALVGWIRVEAQKRPVLSLAHLGS